MGLPVGCVSGLPVLCDSSLSPYIQLGKVRFLKRMIH